MDGLRGSCQVVATTASAGASRSTQSRSASSTSWRGSSANPGTECVSFPITEPWYAPANSQGAPTAVSPQCCIPGTAKYRKNSRVCVMLPPLNKKSFVLECECGQYRGSWFLVLQQYHS